MINAEYFFMEYVTMWDVTCYCVFVNKHMLNVPLIYKFDTVEYFTKPGLTLLI